MSEAEMIVLLRARYTEKAGNGDGWAFIPQVRNAAGFDANRTIDAIAMALWPSRGLILHGIEIKVSRSDWLRELKNPAKAEGFAGLVDYWWLAVADDKIVRPGELPDGWGLLVARGGRLVCNTEAAPLHEVDVPGKRRPLPPGFSRSSLAALLRSACRVSAATPAEVQEAVAAARESERLYSEDEIGRLREQVERYRQNERVFRETAGVPLNGWYGADGGVDKVAAAVRTALTGEQTITTTNRRLAALRDTTARLLADLDRELAGVAPESDLP